MLINNITIHPIAQAPNLDSIFIIFYYHPPTTSIQPQISVDSPKYLLIPSIALQPITITIV